MAQTKVAVVTGVSSGIGRATATVLAQRGFRGVGNNPYATRARAISEGRGHRPAGCPR